ncbi:hypothetical protein ACFV90_19080 [Streptomyces sp. NPDC059904]|uniref:hypothetical protein n=1 Tax=unclassified Streptomyces TaxID=2593676 RepID=UPI003663E2A4
MRDERKYRDDLERRFLDDALRTRTRGFRLLVVAALMWLYILARLLLPPGILLGSGGEHGAGCDGPLLFEEIRSGYDDGIADVCVLEPWPMSSLSSRSPSPSGWPAPSSTCAVSSAPTSVTTSGP